MRLILAEKPSVAMDIARALGTPQKHDGYVTVGADTLTWAYGHLATLAAPDQYDPAWKRWSWATLPMLPDQFQLTAIPKTTGHLTLIKSLMAKADRLGITLLWLPTSSPNLHLIERLWKFVKAECLHGRYDPKFHPFQQAITHCLGETSGRHPAKLKTLLTLNFQVFESAA